MLDSFLIQWGLPTFGLVFGVIALAAAIYASRRFDRKYGHD